MADELSKLQECLDQLLTQMYASLRYTDTNAPIVPIEGQPYNVGAVPPGGESGDGNGGQDDDGDDGDTVIEPDRVEQLRAIAPNFLELSGDIMFKYAQARDLLGKLPGIGVAELEQRRKIAELDQKLQEVEAKREVAFETWNELKKRVDNAATLNLDHSQSSTSKS